MMWPDWYNALEKPTWTPAPAIIIGRNWQILYSVNVVSFEFVFVHAFLCSFRPRP